MRAYLFRTVFWVAMLSLFSTRALALPEDTWVLAIGNNRGEASESRLLYAERDAQELAEVLRRQGDVRSEHLRVLLDEDAQAVQRTLAEVSSALAAGQRKTALLVFYSGHADADALHLRGTRLAFEELRKLVENAPAAVRLLIVDTCRSGTVTRVKGMRPTADFDIQIDNQIETAGTAIFSSSTVDENSQESDRLRGSFFSHHLINALRGAADRNGDGRVTLSETFEYTHSETLRSSGQTMALQHPTYSYDLKGRSDLVLTSIGEAGRSSSRLRLSTAGTYLVHEVKQSGAIVAELTSLRDRALIALPPGRYFVQQRGSLEYREYQLALQPGEELDLHGLRYRVIAYDQLVRKRGGARRSVHGLTLLAGAHGEVLPGAGLMPGMQLGYSADLPWLTLGARLRGGMARWDSIYDGLRAQQYDLGLSLLLQRYIDWPWLSIAIGLSVEGVYQAERFDSTARPAPARNALAFDFAAFLAVERRLYAGLSLRLEGGPLVWLQQRAVVKSGEVIGPELSTTLTYFFAGGLIWRL